MPTFDETLDQVRELLQHRGRLSYRALKRRFELDDEYLEDLKEELIKAERVAVDEDGAVLVWVGGDAALTPSAQQSASLSQSVPSDDPSLHPQTSPQADRRQLTVMFCDLVGSTPMSAQLDPEDYRDIMQAYQEMCGQALTRFTGHIARYEGDGILVYFGYPQAREDAAAQAVRASLNILAGLPDLNARFQHRFPLLQERPLQVRIGLHTGLVVVGEMGSKQYRIDIAVGETPNMAARIQGQAGPNEIIISAATYKLVEGLFACEELEPRTLKGIAAPQSVYRIKGESEAQSRFEVIVQKGLTPLVGRVEEVGLLHRRWERAQTGAGQVVLLSGEPGIGKSRLVQELKEQVAAKALGSVECRCSPNTQNSALAPVIEHLQRLLGFEHNEASDTKIHKLEQFLTRYRLPLSDSVPLLVSLLALSGAERYPPPQFSPQKQKEKTLELLLTWLRADTEQQPACLIFEDLHWADPSTLEFLTLLVDQVTTMHALLILTFRPEFLPPWPSRAHMLSLQLDHLPEAHIAEMAQNVAGKVLPSEIVQQLVTKTDGVPLFIEELTKTVVESGHLQTAGDRYELVSPLQEVTIPATLQDSLRARLDRLNTAQEIAQIGATIGREFSYELLQAVSPLEEETLQQGLRQLAAADLVSQKGLPPQAQYVFKHALIQDSAYQSMLRSTRQHYHHQIAQVLEERFAELTEAQPELVAHHLTEAGLIAQAIPYWQRAGQRAVKSSSNAEAISHLTKGLELLSGLPETAERAQQELLLRIALGSPFIATKGYGSPDVQETYARSQELCQQIGETPQLFPMLYGLCAFATIRGDRHKARTLADQLLGLAQSVQDSSLLILAHRAVGGVFFQFGEDFVRAREHFTQGLALYNPQEHGSLALRYGSDPGMTCSSFMACTLWYLGYPDQALKSIHAAVSLARDLAHPYSEAGALCMASWISIYRREGLAAQEQAEAVIQLSSDHGFTLTLSLGQTLRGWALAEQGRSDEGIHQIQQGIAGLLEAGGELNRPFYLALLAETYGKAGRAEEGLAELREGLRLVNKKGDRFHEPELHRITGELLLNTERERWTDQTSSTQAEACFQKAIERAQSQQAKSLELRAATSLARLWQQQGKPTEARALLAPVYNWFTEGFDTKDLQEAKALLSELS